MGEKQSKAARGAARGAYAGAVPAHMPGGAAAAFPRSQTVDFQRKYGFIPDQFTSLQQVSSMLPGTGRGASARFPDIGPKLPTFVDRPVPLWIAHGHEEVLWVPFSGAGSRKAP